METNLHEKKDVWTFFSDSHNLAHCESEVSDSSESKTQILWGNRDISPQ
jgi:hypothetical protein